MSNNSMHSNILKDLLLKVTPSSKNNDKNVLPLGFYKFLAFFDNFLYMYVKNATKILI